MRRSLRGQGSPQTVCDAWEEPRGKAGEKSRAALRDARKPGQLARQKGPVWVLEAAWESWLRPGESAPEGNPNHLSEQLLRCPERWLPALMPPAPKGHWRNSRRRCSSHLRQGYSQDALHSKLVSVVPPGFSKKPPGDLKNANRLFLCAGPYRGWEDP